MQDGQIADKPVKATIVRVGSELVAVLPAAEAARLGITEGDAVEVRASSEAPASTKMTREEALDVLRGMRGLVPADYKFNRDDAYGRGPDADD